MSEPTEESRSPLVQCQMALVAARLEAEVARADERKKIAEWIESMAVAAEGRAKRRGSGWSDYGRIYRELAAELRKARP